MTSVAEIRFYAELNDFLAPERRQQDVRYGFHVAPSVKDAVEALGVPHTEVDLILANGVPVDFSYRLADGDRISVYPVFEAIDVSSVSRLRSEPLRRIRFVADTHLGTLARYLRLLGFDTGFHADRTDDDLAGISADERRVLLTRDRGLLKRRAVTHGLFIRADDPEQQLIDVVRRLHLLGQLRPFSRCMACNDVIEPVDKRVVAERLEPRTRREFDQFSLCRGCGRVYWEGSHHRRLLGIVERVRQEASGRAGEDGEASSRSR
ncbi:MAG TPA: Mut7-C RNAse domain-containing protein [Acidimicrobiia bacterium]|nr:Mut7-C RNAse domain-containing protein [Acidimicrobiia bacterium]